MTETPKEYKGIKYTVDVSDYGISIRYLLRYTELIIESYPKYKWFTTEQNDYQGEWFAIGYDPRTEHYYFSQGSFGSCSGCDWYQSIHTEAEAEEYIDKMQQIIDIGEKDDAIKYLTNEINTTWNDARKELTKLISWILENND